LLCILGCDISILQEDGHPWFITTRHEGFAYFLLHEHEVAYACQIFGRRIAEYTFPYSVEDIEEEYNPPFSVEDIEEGYNQVY